GRSSTAAVTSNTCPHARRTRWRSSSRCSGEGGYPGQVSRVVFACLLAGCRGILGFEDVQTTSADAPVDVRDSSTSFCGGTFVRVCLPSVTSDVSLDATTPKLDTGTSTLCRSDATISAGLDACVIAV